MTKKEYLLVDGYNIIYAWNQLKDIAVYSLEGARDKLLEILSDYQGYKDIEIIVVFDGHLVKGNIGTELYYNFLKVVYTKELESADSYIERETNQLVKKYKVTVATSDNLEQKIILGQGALRISARELKIEVAQSKKEMQTKYIENKPVKNNLLFDNLDRKTAEKFENMRLNKR